MCELCNQAPNVIKDGFEEVGLFVWWYSFVCNDVRIGVALLLLLLLVVVVVVVLLGLRWSKRKCMGKFFWWWW